MYHQYGGSFTSDINQASHHYAMQFDDIAATLPACYDLIAVVV